MGAFCVPQFDLCIIVRRDSNIKQSTLTKGDASSYELYKTAEAIVVTREDSNLSHREHEWREHREIATINPWIRGDPCLIFADQSSIWLQAKIVKIYETECKVDVYSNELRWPKHRTYGALSQFIMAKVSDAKDLNMNDMPLIDRLHNGTKVKLWGPPWRKGRVLWKWNESDLVCIQLNDQRLEYAQTYHVNDEKWKIQILDGESSDNTDIQPPLQFIMAKRKYLALSNEVINSGLLVVSSDSDSNSEQECVENEEKQQNNKHNDDVVQVIDITSNENTTTINRKKQRLNKIKIINMKQIKFKKISPSKQPKKKRKKIKKKQGIEVYGINEGDIYYPDDVLNIKWKLNRCVIHDDDDDDDDMKQREKAFNIYLESTNYLLGMDGKPQPEIDQILLASHVSLKQNVNGEYCHSVLLPISFLKYDYDENEESNSLQQAACLIRIVFVNNDYYFYRLNGTSQTFELRNKIKQINAVKNNNEINQTAMDIEQEQKNENENDIEIEIENVGNNDDKEIEYVDDTELNANDQIHKDDNGAFCLCGAVQEDIDEAVEEQKDKIVEWIQCDFCHCWMHLKCLNIDKQSIEEYKCLWCCNEDENEENNLKYFDNSKTIKILKFVKNLFSASRYRGKRYGFWYGKKQKFDDEKYSDLNYLKNLCIARGVDSKSNDIETLKNNLTYSSKFARTPLTLSNFMCSLFGINNQKKQSDEYNDENKLNCVDLMAGNGNIARFIAKHHNILAVEKRESRMESGKHLVPNATWIGMDVFCEEFIEKYVVDKAYDVVYCNPDLNNVIPSIYIGLQMIKRSECKKKCLIYLLPVDVFESDSFQCRLFRLLGCHISKMYQVGRWNYFDKDKSHPKSICDAVWIIKPGRKSMKYEFRCYDVRINQKLSTKALET